MKLKNSITFKKIIKNVIIHLVIFAKNLLNSCNNCQNMLKYKSKQIFLKLVVGGTLLKDRLNDYKLPIFMGSFFVRF